MSKFFRIAAEIVAVAAIVVATAGTATPALAPMTVAGSAGATAAASTVAISFAGVAATGASIGGISAGLLSTIAGGLGMVGSLLAKKPAAGGGGSQTSWKADPNAGIPMVIGRTGDAGNIIYRQVYGDEAHWQMIITVNSGGGPIQSYDQIFLDGKPYSKSTIGGTYLGILLTDSVDYPGGNVWEQHQLGATPEAGYLNLAPNPPAHALPPEWDPTHKLNGLAASSMHLHWDPKGDHTMTQPPQLLQVMHGVLVYDPRKDSTYPGGSGSHRWADPSNTAAHDAARLTWEWSENPYLHALHWALGRWERDPAVTGSAYKKVLGAGIPISAIMVDQFVEGANVADANGWAAGGTVYSTDDKWDVFKKILQAGGGEPVRLGARIGCIVNTPRVSLATINPSDIIGDATVQATQPRRDRINACIPKIRFEDLVWEQDDASPVVVDDYVTFDGRQRNKEVTFDLVQCKAGEDPTQGVQLARYEIENAREFGPINLPLKLRWMGYKPGDCVTVNEPELGLTGQLMLILNRELEPSTAVVTFTGRSETTAKHAFALGQTGTAPTTPSVAPPPIPPDANNDTWAITATAISANGTIIPALVIEGAVGPAVPAELVLFEYREYVSGAGINDNWQSSGAPEGPQITKKNIAGLKDGADYEVSIRYRMGIGYGARLILGPETVSATIVGSPVMDVNRQLVTIEQDYTGAPLGGQYPLILSFSRQLGDADVTADTSWSILSTTGSLTTGGGGNTSINDTFGDPDRGKVTITAGTGNVTVQSARTGEQSLAKTVTLTPHVNAPPTNTSTSTLGNITSTSNNTVVSGLSMVAGGTSISCTAASVHFRSGSLNGSSNIKLQWAISTSLGGTYTAVGSLVTGSAEVPGSATKYGPIPGADGVITCNQTATGLTPGSTYYFKLIGQSTGTPGSPGSYPITLAGTASLS